MIKTKSNTLQARVLDGLLHFVNPNFAVDMFSKFEGKEIEIVILDKSDYKTKNGLFKYYYGYVLEAALNGYLELGFNLNKEAVDDIFKQTFATSVYYDQYGREREYTRNKSSMNKYELKRYVMQCLYFTELELGMYVPDSDKFKQSNQKQEKHGEDSE